MKKQDSERTIIGGSMILSAVIPVMMLALVAMPAVASKPQVTDMSITDAVEDELVWDSAVPALLIDVMTADGIVTLRGSVDNILAKERAERIAMTVKGVRAVVNEIHVNPPFQRTDRQIQKDVEQALLIDPATDSYEVNVQVNENVVTLSGVVESWQEKDLCEIVAKGVKGVEAVDNRLSITWPEKQTDPEIEADVKETLKWDANVDHGLIDVKVKDGKVILSGTVGSAAEKNFAERDAYVQGVRSVDTSDLKVKRWSRDQDLKEGKYVNKSAEEIEDAVRDAMRYDPRVISFEVTPEVAPDGTTLILRGMVDNLKAKRAATQDARDTVGVKRVDNRIDIKPTIRISDQKIEDKVKSAILRDPYLESYAISVNVNNGVVKLHGTVDTYFEKAEADDVASRVEGVIMIDNNLGVQQDYHPYICDPYVEDSYLYDNDWCYYRPSLVSKSDRQIKADIEKQLFWSPFVDADDVKVDVEKGVATLTGTVDSWSESNAAVNNAYEGGAVYVDNELNVK
jgi:osmotically-inducible protein OsmY